MNGLLDHIHTFKVLEIFEGALRDGMRKQLEFIQRLVELILDLRRTLGVYSAPKIGALLEGLIKHATEVSASNAEKTQSADNASSEEIGEREDDGSFGELLGTLKCSYCVSVLICSSSMTRWSSQVTLNLSPIGWDSGFQSSSQARPAHLLEAFGGL